MPLKYCIASALFLTVAALLPPAAAAAPMATGAPAVPPTGFVGFCARHLPDCAGAAAAAGPVALTDERRRQLDDVQAEINRSIRPREDPAHVWDYPVDGTGDCNKFALAKRRALRALGWPSDALLLATALTETGEGHLVLVAHTSGGDLVLDNRLAPVVDWTRLPYHWLSRQSERLPTQWVTILGAAATLADAR